jgi:23S rRNA (cytidine2498-2'-O)-methyltransferase
MHVFLCADDAEAELRAELADSMPDATLSPAGPLMFGLELATMPPRLPHLVFARQWLPFACSAEAESIRAWARLVAGRVIGVLPDDQPWLMHIEPHYGARARHHIGARAWHSTIRKQEAASLRTEAPLDCSPGAAAGRHRCELIREAVIDILQKQRRHLLRRLRREPAPFDASESLVQLLLTAPDRGWISVALAPLPFEQRHLLSPFPKGEVPVASDKAAPSRAFAKLVEAELRMGRAVQAGETCIDLGASPGSWTYTAVNRGARVIAVDRAALRDDLMHCARVKFHPGDALSYVPERPVDWLLCDVIAAPEQSAKLLREWLRNGWCRHFIVTLKLKDSPNPAVLTALKHDVRAMTHEFFLTRLCANKKEACAFGTAKRRSL